MKAYHYLIKGPIITEKTHTQREVANKLTFRVDLKANKIEIRKAIEDIFNGLPDLDLVGLEVHPEGQFIGHFPLGMGLFRDDRPFDQIMVRLHLANLASI